MIGDVSGVWGGVGVWWWCVYVILALLQSTIFLPTLDLGGGVRWREGSGD